MTSARSIAGRYSADPRLRPILSGCIAVAGLLAETGATFKESEAAVLRRLSALEEDTLNEMLLSADRFLSDRTEEPAFDARYALVQRLGIFGIRLGVRAVREDGLHSATELARLFQATSGIEDLKSVIRGRFADRAAVLKSRTALLAITRLGRELAERSSSEGAELLARVEAIEASDHELAELRLLHMTRNAALRLSDAEAAEIEAVIGSPEVSSKLGIDPASNVEPDVARSVCLRAIQRWRERESNPLLDRDEVFACRTITRSYEGIYSRLVSGA